MEEQKKEPDAEDSLSSSSESETHPAEVKRQKTQKSLTSDNNNVNAEATSDIKLIVKFLYY